MLPSNRGIIMKLTAKSATTLSLDGVKDRTWFDDDISGFGIRLREGGSGTYIYRYRHGTQQRSITLGSTAAVPFSLARKNAGELEAKVRLGGDPAADKRSVRQESANTFAAVAQQFLAAKRKEWRTNTLDSIQRHLSLYADILHGKPITAITQRDVALLLNKVAAESGDTTANRLRASLCAMWSWAIKQGLPLTNVAALTEKRREQSRDRVLSEAELVVIWQQCGDDDFGRIIKLLILTGQRKAEIGQLRWDEVHDTELVLTPDRVKNGRVHTVPLSPLTSQLVGTRTNHLCLFGRSKRGFRGFAHAKANLDKRIASPRPGSRILPWVVHDIRRSVATHMAELCIQPHVIEAVLNHVSGHKAGVAGIYNRASYAKEKREALTLWAEHLAKLVG
jgi:integrase